mmetsp:Transcript_30683/g.66927  ORF Transcript_30683/g.66927 Transcript_30683/m.66927 type:complete len:177 (-) Transcript_30683:162-692(-)
MPCYHSRQNEEYPSMEETCSCAVCPIKSDIRGPSPHAPPDKEDIIDETLSTFRANVLFRNFDVRTSADRTLIYLTLYTHQCLVKLEKIEDKATALRELHALAIKQFVCPGDSGWPLGTLFPQPAGKAEGDLFKAYFKQARDELGIRLVGLMFEDGSKSKWWQAFSKRKFMGKELKD